MLYVDHRRSSVFCCLVPLGFCLIVYSITMPRFQKCELFISSYGQVSGIYTETEAERRWHRGEWCIRSSERHSGLTVFSLHIQGVFTHICPTPWHQWFNQPSNDWFHHRRPALHRMAGTMVRTLSLQIKPNDVGRYWVCFCISKGPPRKPGGAMVNLKRNCWATRV